MTEELKLLFEEEEVRDKTEQENKAECSVGDTFVVASHEHKTGEDSVLEEIKLEIEPGIISVKNIFCCGFFYY